MDNNIRKYEREEMPDFVLEDFDKYTQEFNDIFYRMLETLSPDMCHTLLVRIHAAYIFHLVKLHKANIHEIALLCFRGFVQNLESLSGDELL